MRGINSNFSLKKGDTFQVSFKNKENRRNATIDFPRVISNNWGTKGFIAHYEKDYDSISTFGTIDLHALAMFLRKQKLYIKKFWYQVSWKKDNTANPFLQMQMPIILKKVGTRGSGGSSVEKFVLDPYQKQRHIVVCNTPFILDGEHYIETTILAKLGVTFKFEVAKIG